MDPVVCPSPNFAPRPPDKTVDLLILHYTGMPSAAAALDRLCDAAAEVSAHYLIDEDGVVYRLVEEGCVAWHAGKSAWAGATDINARSIGIELVNPGHEFGYRAFPEPQMQALIPLCLEILGRHPIAPTRVLGHADVAPLRKEDPGELFDWPRLAGAGIGVVADAAAPVPVPSERRVKQQLARFGYGYVDEDLPAVIRAFQRHFQPDAVTGRLDPIGAGRLAALLAHVDAA